MALESKSSSRCTTETAKGTHVLEIVGYSLKKGLGIGKFVQSAIFTVGGYDWTIRFYPDGANMSYADCVCVSVSREPTGRGLARASCDLRLVNKDTGLPKSIWFLSQATPTEFDYGNRVFPECGGFIERSELELEGSGYIKDDSLTIECVLTVIKQSQVTKTTGSSEIKVSSSNLSDHFDKLLLEG
uniref:MATH domain-containing protein n=1 Tax=Triticum aestivum TaxID=4565 RepID=A0A3B6JF81_WHEAT